MLTLLTSGQMRFADAHTVSHQFVPSIELMERAAQTFSEIFAAGIPDKTCPIAVFCGQGNNGGDGLAIARILYEMGYQNIQVYLANFSGRQTDDYTINLTRLKETSARITIITEIEKLKVSEASVIIDALLGSGLSRPLSGGYADLVNYINHLNLQVYSVDLPTGFPAEGGVPEQGSYIKAFKTICFQRPKINFFFPESAGATESFITADIGLDEEFIQAQPSDFYLPEEEDIKKIVRVRKRFSHKGSYGHSLIVAGNIATMGAAILASRGCLYGGAGLVTACVPQSGLTAFNAAVPEVMVLPRDEYLSFGDMERFNSIAVGPGIGVSHENARLLETLFYFDKPLVLDADALNILAEEKGLLLKLPAHSVLTPHMKEFDRLFGVHDNWWDRVQTARSEAGKMNVIIVIKNQYTFICTPDTRVYINPTGNPAMAQGGMGDVLTGLISAFMAQGYTAADSAMMACYVHGKAGDTLAEEQFNITAGQLAARLPFEIKALIK